MRGRLKSFKKSRVKKQFACEIAPVSLSEAIHKSWFRLKSQVWAQPTLTVDTHYINFISPKNKKHVRRKTFTARFSFPLFLKASHLPFVFRLTFLRSSFDGKSSSLNEQFSDENKITDERQHKWKKLFHFFTIHLKFFLPTVSIYFRAEEAARERNKRRFFWW